MKKKITHKTLDNDIKKILSGKEMIAGLKKEMKKDNFPKMEIEQVIDYLKKEYKKKQLQYIEDNK